MTYCAAGGRRLGLGVRVPERAGDSQHHQGQGQWSRPATLRRHSELENIDSRIKILARSSVNGRIPTLAGTEHHNIGSAAGRKYHSTGNRGLPWRPKTGGRLLGRRVRIRRSGRQIRSVARWPGPQGLVLSTAARDRCRQTGPWSRGSDPCRPGRRAGYWASPCR